jgi:hypothetical protein
MAHVALHGVEIGQIASREASVLSHDLRFGHRGGQKTHSVGRAPKGVRDVTDMGVAWPALRRGALREEECT